MKIIEALKQIKDLARKAEDLRKKIGLFCADMDYEAPIYPDQRAEVSGWLQANKDIIREIGRLKLCIARTNVNTMVTINLDNAEVTKTILEWINRKKDLVALEKMGWSALSNRGLKDGRAQQSSGQIVECKVRYYYDPKQKDKWMDILGSEPSLIDGKLEIVNATTDLME